MRISLSRSIVAGWIFQLVFRRLVRHGRLSVVIGGVGYEFRGRNQGLEGSMTIEDPSALIRSVFRSGSVGFAEAYIDGDWWSTDLAGLLEFFIDNHDQRRGSRLWVSALRMARFGWTRLGGRLRTPAVRNMVEHYDLGNEFFSAWLDHSMSYSSGIFVDGADLDAAMRSKHELIAVRAGIEPGDRILEIGCGWGAMAEYAAVELACTVTAVTISAEQHSYVEQRMKRAGVDDRVEVLLADFREVEGEYDRVISIEMIESVDQTSWPELYDVIARSLVPGGTAALQVITIDHDLHEEMIGRDEFIRSYIFPGGALPSERVLQQLGNRVGLEWVGSSTHGPSYALTLEEWDRRFVAAWPQMASPSARFDDTFYRMWRYYLAYCIAGFRTWRLDGAQVLYRKPVEDALVHGNGGHRATGDS